MGTLFNPDYETDQHLWRRVAGDDHTAFNILFKKYWHPLLAITARYIDDTIEREDVIQELFINIYQKRHILQAPKSVHAYLVVAARNQARNYLRNRSVYRKHVSSLGGRMLLLSNETEETILYNEMQGKVNNALSVMPHKCRQVYALTKEYRMTVSYTARILERPVGTVEKQLRKAIGILRDGLEKT
jgi:RNA polymerase sigma-70 factor (ECF subfamily)